MKAVDQELGIVLTRERRLLIPTYQRDYEWTEDGQWQLLADDILGVTTRAFEADLLSAGGGTASADRLGPHFLGAIVLEALPQRGAQVNAAAVIDGQQRLTTIFLLLRGLLDLLTERQISARAKQVRKWILINPDDVEEQYEIYKLWPRRRDRSEWEAVMADEVPTISHRYLDARLYFYDRFKSVTEGMTLDEANSFLGTLVDTLASKIKLVVVDLEVSDDAQLIFEVLNGRQTPLSASDLVKNLLFMKANVSDKDLDRLYDEYWAPFDEAWWGGMVGRGHAARGRRDQLLATWLTIKTSDEVNLGRLYGEARSYLASTTEPLQAVLSGISHLAREYKSIYDHNDDDPEPIAQTYLRLERLGVTTAVPLLAWLRTLPSDQLTREQHIRAVSAVDSFVVRRLITSMQTRAYGRVFLEVLQKAQAAADSMAVDEAVVQAFLDQPHGYSWPTDQEVTDDFVRRTLYGRMRQENIRLILGPIDAYLRNQNSKSERAIFDYDTLTIEHVMPREWREHWSTPEVPSDQLAAAEIDRDAIVHRIGNLTLITGILNSSVSNGPWNEKRASLEAHSNLALNAKFKDLETWNEAEIEKRGRQLAAAACAIWARPAEELDK